ncbi:sensor histidine kinase [Lacticaseibacillus absianus]|uniref:sensor histidine kinase n=1 Tax=Lacticaseibacillus absianus TaxID=2729623 RepID=UPI0015CEC694|nr:sensor histidine kinase [Lacticaseibacillus absianus]
MRLRDYLHDHLIQIAVFLVGLGAFCFGLWLDPDQQVRLSTLVYVAALTVLAGAGFLWWRYRVTRAWLRQLQARTDAGAGALDWPLPPAHTVREQTVVTAYNHLLREHQRSQSTLLANQQDQKSFIDSWVHEIKVPLAASRLLTDSLDGRAPEVEMDQLTLQLDRIDHYVEQVLYYARLDSFARDYLLQEHGLRAIVDAVIVDARNRFIAQHIRFTLTGHDQVVVTDDKWLRFILAQLVSNALKYTADGGLITATLAATRDEVTLAIQDSGIGIPDDEQHRVFEKGFTGTNGRNANQKSTGLGLYLAQRLSDKLGHHLTLTSRVGKGTTVTLHFPNLSYYGESGPTLTKPQLQKGADRHGDHDDI